MTKIVLMILCLLPGLIFPQMIINVAEGHVLIDTDVGIGATGDTVIVYSGKNNKTGSVSIVKFKDGMAVCKILEGNVKIGDRIQSSPWQAADALFDHERRYRDGNESRNWNAKIGFITGAFVPFGHFSNQDSISLNIGGFISFPISARRDELVFELSYLVSNMGSDINNIVKSYGFDVTTSLIMISAYARCNILPTIFIDSGCGLYFPTVPISSVLEPSVRRKACVGLCFGPTFQFTHSSSSNIYLSTKFHAYQAGDDWVQFIRTDIQFAFTM